jgi:hypothetical protein
MKSTPIVLIALLLVPLAALGQYPWSNILPPGAGIDWSQVGIPGGIPSGSWTQSGSTISASQCDNGAGDCTATIQKALKACGSNHYVLLGAGTFMIKQSVWVPSYCVLRGSGADQTILNVKGKGGAPILLGSGTLAYFGVSRITGGATAGSTSIEVKGHSGVKVGGYLVIAENNDNVIVDVRGGEGNCNWCDGGWTRDARLASGQIVQVTAVSSHAVGITPGLYRTYANSPIAVPFHAMAKYAGVEALQIYSNNTGYEQDVNLSRCAYCWVKGIESNYTDGDYVDVYWGYRDEIRDSYFSNAYRHTPGSADSDVSLLNKTSGSLVENNIIERGHASVLLSWGAAGNVIAYNYCEGGFDAGSLNFVIGGMGMHGAHPQFNLLEGNVTPTISPDQIWGSNAYNTLFRNWTEGTTLACNPTSGRGTVVCSPIGQNGGSGINGWWPFQASRALELTHLATHYSVIGNVAGSANQNALLEYGKPTSHVAVLQYPTPRIYGSTNYNMAFGYGESGDPGPAGTGCSGSTNPPCHSTNAYATGFIHGNYTYADDSVDNWVSGVTHTLPASFYHASKPSWWGALPYPAIGPEVTGGPGANGHAGLIPAQNCYFNVMGGSEGGAGSPLQFNADKCYSHGSLTPPRNTVGTKPQ